MIIKAELLGDNVDNQRLLARGKLIDALSPQGDCESQKQHGFNQDNGKFQVRRNGARHAEMIRIGLSPFSETN